MGKDWDAVARAISTRMAELDLTQQEVANRAGVSIQTVRELQQNLLERKRTPRTLQVMSTALELPPGHLAAVLGRRSVSEPDQRPEEMDVIRNQLTSIADQLTDIAGRLTKLS